jgi:hypothetical protein
MARIIKEKLNAEQKQKEKETNQILANDLGMNLNSSGISELNKTGQSDPLNKTGQSDLNKTG